MTFEKTGLAAILDFMDRPEVEFRKEKKNIYPKTYPYQAYTVRVFQLSCIVFEI